MRHRHRRDRDRLAGHITGGRGHRAGQLLEFCSQVFARGLECLGRVSDDEREVAVDQQRGHEALARGSCRAQLPSLNLPLARAAFGELLERMGQRARRVKLDSGLKLLEDIPGTGAVARKGDRVTYNLRLFLNQGDEIPLDEA